MYVTQSLDFFFSYKMFAFSNMEWVSLCYYRYLHHQHNRHNTDKGPDIDYLKIL